MYGDYCWLCKKTFCETPTLALFPFGDTCRKQIPLNNIKFAFKCSWLKDFIVNTSCKTAIFFHLQFNTRSTCIQYDKGHTWQDLCSFAMRWIRMSRDVKISPDFPMSIPLTVPWPWGELIPDQCAKLDELQYLPIGPGSASTLLKRTRPRAASPHLRPAGAFHDNAACWKIKSWPVRMFGSRIQSEHKDYRKAFIHRHIICTNSYFK